MLRNTMLVGYRGVVGKPCTNRALSRRALAMAAILNKARWDSLAQNSPHHLVRLNTKPDRSGDIANAIDPSTCRSGFVYLRGSVVSPSTRLLVGEEARQPGNHRFVCLCDTFVASNLTYISF